MLISPLCSRILIKITTRIRGHAHGNETEWDVRADKSLLLWIGEFWGDLSISSTPTYIHLCALSSLLCQMVIGAYNNIYIQYINIYALTAGYTFSIMANDLFVMCQQIWLRNVSSREHFIPCNHLT